MIKKILTFLAAATALFAIPACTLVDEPPAEAGKYGFPDDTEYLCGFTVWFSETAYGPYDEDTASTDLKSGNAVKYMLVYEPQSDPLTVTVEKGKDVVSVPVSYFFQGNLFGEGGHVLINATVYHCGGQNKNYAKVVPVYYNPVTWQTRAATDEARGPFYLAIGDFTAPLKQNLGYEMPTGDGGTRTISFEAEVNVSLVQEKRVTAVTISEYSAQSGLIKSAEFAPGEAGEEYAASQNCDFVIVEETEEDGTKNREVVSRTDEKTIAELRTPTDDGFVKRTKLKINFGAAQ